MYLKNNYQCKFPFRAKVSFKNDKNKDIFKQKCHICDEQTSAKGNAKVFTSSGRKVIDTGLMIRDGKSEIGNI